MIPKIIELGISDIAIGAPELPSFISPAFYNTIPFPSLNEVSILSVMTLIQVEKKVLQVN